MRPTQRRWAFQWEGNLETAALYGSPWLLSGDEVFGIARQNVADVWLARCHVVEALSTLYPGGAQGDTYRAWSHDAHFQSMHTSPRMYPLCSKMNNLSHNDRIELAITDRDSQIHPNYKATAEKWKIDRSTLSRRHRGVTTTRETATSTSRKALTDT